MGMVEVWCGTSVVSSSPHLHLHGTTGFSLSVELICHIRLAMTGVHTWRRCRWGSEGGGAGGGVIGTTKASLCVLIMSFSDTLFRAH